MLRLLSRFQRRALVAVAVIACLQGASTAMQVRSSYSTMAKLQTFSSNAQAARPAVIRTWQQEQDAHALQAALLFRQEGGPAIQQLLPDTPSTYSGGSILQTLHKLLHSLSSDWSAAEADGTRLVSMGMGMGMGMGMADASYPVRIPATSTSSTGEAHSMQDEATISSSLSPSDINATPCGGHGHGHGRSLSAADGSAESGQGGLVTAFAPDPSSADALISQGAGESAQGSGRIAFKDVDEDNRGAGTGRQLDKVIFWLPGVVAVSSDEDSGQKTVRVGPMGSLVTVEAPPAGKAGVRASTPPKPPGKAGKQGKKDRSKAAETDAAGSAAAVAAASDVQPGMDPIALRTSGADGKDMDIGSGNTAGVDAGNEGMAVMAASRQEADTISDNQGPNKSATSGDASSSSGSSSSSSSRGPVKVSVGPQGSLFKSSSDSDGQKDVSVGPVGLVYRQTSEKGPAGQLGRTQLDVLGGAIAAVKKDESGNAVSVGPQGAIYRSTYDTAAERTTLDVLRSAVAAVDSDPTGADVAVGPKGMVLWSSSREDEGTLDVDVLRGV